jgi:CDP-glycerol glycerophosphotransferase (TagB/SpsB family)
LCQLHIVMEKLYKILNLLLTPVYYLIYLLVFFMPRDKSVWVFGSWNGIRFADNAKWFYLYCNTQNDLKIKYIWITKKKEISRSLRNQNYKAYYLYSPKGIWYACRAGVYVFDSFSRDISFWLSNGAKKILLQHGVPIKKIGRDIDNKNNLFYKCYHGNFLEKTVLSIIRPWWVEKYDLIPATSEYCAECFRTAFDAQIFQTPVTGFPRNDVIFDESLNNPVNTQEKCIDEYNEFSHIVLYMPTFRDSDRRHRTIPIEWDRLNTLFKENNAVFVLKLHPNEHFHIDVGSYSNIGLLNPGIDIYSGIRDTDLLITDYSSISFDFMNANKTVLFYIYDYDSYTEKDRSLYINFNEVIQTQPKAYDFSELFQILGKWLNKPDDFETNTRKMSEKFHYYADGNNSKRIMKNIQKLVKM